jgi:hypothetical protein
VNLHPLFALAEQTGNALVRENAQRLVKKHGLNPVAASKERERSKVLFTVILFVQLSRRIRESFFFIKFLVFPPPFLCSSVVSSRRS